VNDSYVQDHSFCALAGWPRSRKVFGYFPSPQILNEPKSLTQSFRRYRLRFPPDLELVKIIDRDLAFTQPIEQMIA
jgi:hypothetical protein